jgi:hypothetical protein
MSFSRSMTRLLIRLLRISCASLVCLGIMLGEADAMTEGERALANTPLPHQKLAAGRDSVKVHWARVHGYVQGKDGPEALLNDLKERFRDCAQLAREAGRDPQPPKEWPDYVQSIQSEIYQGTNRTIRYDTTLLYGISPMDCRLTESRGAVAKLWSMNGVCAIDLVEKRADGACDSKAHAAAPVESPYTHARATSPNGGNANDPQVQVALKKAMQQFGPVATGERKTIAGIECDVLTLKVGVESSECISRGGSFAGWHGTPRWTGAHLILESSWVGGIYSRAVEAKLDAQVNAAVFAPYLAGGFQVNNGVRHR